MKTHKDGENTFIDLESYQAIEKENSELKLEILKLKDQLFIKDKQIKDSLKLYKEVYELRGYFKNLQSILGE